jgi:protein-S-isoprenylcysteine O-methyltransferase Ste14
MNYQLIIIIVVSLVLTILSRRSLDHPTYHGFYRFLAWELIVIQVAINIPFWFTRSFCWQQLISWFLLCLSLFVAYQGFYMLHRLGGDRISRNDNLNYNFENTSILVTEGIYAYIRHPMYCSLLLLSWGTFFKSPNLPGIIISVLTSLCLYLTARREEKENIRTFGSQYYNYMQKSKMFIPYLI